MARGTHPERVQSVQTNASKPVVVVLNPRVHDVRIVLRVGLGDKPLLTRQEFPHVNWVNPWLEPLWQVVPLTAGFDTLVSKTTVAVQLVAVHSEE